MRTITDLSLELEIEGGSGKWQSIALVVVYPSDEDKPDLLIFFPTSADRHKELNEAIRNGGEPIGFIGIGDGGIQTRLLSEHQDDSAAEEHLWELAASVGKKLLEKGIAKSVEPIGTGSA